MSIEEDIQQAISVLRAGGVILYPTDTIWGIGCDATNAAAIQRVYQIKQRPDSKALICLVDSPNRLTPYVAGIPAVAWDLMDCNDKPLTIIFDQGKNLPSCLLAEDGSIAMRVTHEQVSQQLCYRFQKPIVSTSANISEEPAPQCFADISPELINSVDYVMQSRRQEHRPQHPSSIIKLTQNAEITIIRP